MNDFMKELKEMQIWFLWQWTPDKNGKPTKTPISVNGTPTGTTMNWSHTWVTYDEAFGSVESQHAAGVGFKIPDGYFFLDADHYSLEDPFIKLILERFNSYTERSVSGGGLHIYGKCNISKLPIVYDADGKAKLDRTYYIKNPSNNLELYKQVCSVHRGCGCFRTFEGMYFCSTCYIGQEYEKSRKETLQ